MLDAGRIRVAMGVVGAALLLAGGRASAQETVPPPPPPAPPPAAGVVQGPPRFGSPAQIVVSTDLLLAVLNSKTGDSASTTVFAVRPAVDIFVRRNLSVGGSVAVQLNAGASDLTSYALAVRAGYSISITDTISVWPRLGVGYSSTGYTSNGMGVEVTSIGLSGIAPLLWQPTGRFFVGVGPVLDQELVRKTNGAPSDKSTQYGVRSLIGGTFGGG